MGKQHCCEMMTENVNKECDIHIDKYDCPDMLISYHETYDEYGLIIHDGGASNIHIDYCPWCATKLPESKR